MIINSCIKCGRQPKIRYKQPFNWFECKCGRKSIIVCDYYEQVDGDSINEALRDWNIKNPKEKVDNGTR